MAQHIEIGKKGEEMALAFLREKGFQILEVNWRYKHLELDIVAMDGLMLVVVEVKTRSNDQAGQPQDSVGRAKQKLLIEAAAAYIREKDLDIETRFDIVSIYFSEKKPFIQHIPEAFTPIW